MKNLLRRQDLIYPELSYKIIGCAFEVFNELGFGHSEKLYQRAIAIEFKRNNIGFTEQLYTPLKFKGVVVGRFYMDYLVEDKIIVEIKKSGFFSKQNIDQVNEYLRCSKMHLALLINFTPTGVITKRLVNVQLSESAVKGKP